MIQLAPKTNLKNLYFKILFHKMKVSKMNYNIWKSIVITPEIFKRINSSSNVKDSVSVRHINFTR